MCTTNSCGPINVSLSLSLSLSLYGPFLLCVSICISVYIILYSRKKAAVSKPRMFGKCKVHCKFYLSAVVMYSVKMYNWKSYVVHNNAATTQLFLPDEKRPPRLRKIITSTSISISQVCSSLTVCIIECKALVAKG